MIRINLCGYLYKSRKVLEYILLWSPISYLIKHKLKSISGCNLSLNIPAHTIANTQRLDSVLKWRLKVDRIENATELIQITGPVIREALSTNLVVKGKERKSIYIAPFGTKVHTKRSGMDHTVLPANNTMPAFPSWHSPDVTTTATEAANIQLQLTTTHGDPVPPKMGIDPNFWPMSVLAKRHPSHLLLSTCLIVH